jgi:hypothetical protein
MRIAAMMMQRDEGALLDVWVSYHARLFGPENLYILDNYSADIETIVYLSRAERLGANVRRGVKDFQAKGVYFSDMIASMSKDYDVFFPLDCDEFVGTFTNNILRTDRDSLLSELYTSVRSPCLLRIDQAIYNVPHTSGGYVAWGKKVAVAGRTDIRLDMGFHLYDFTKKAPTVEGIKPSNLVHLHFHNRPFPELLIATRRKLSPRVSSFDRATLQSYKGTGYHLANYLLISEVDYLSNLKKPEIDFREHFDHVGLPVPFSEKY